MEHKNFPQNQAEQDQMLGYEPSPLYAGESVEMTEAQKDWAAAAQYYWARAYFLMTNGDFGGMATVATAQAMKAESRASAIGALAAAFAGGMTPCKDAEAIRLGKTLDATEVAQAKAAVMAKAEAMGAFKTPADYRRERHEANKAETARIRARQQAEREADAPARAARVATAQAAKAEAAKAKAAEEAAKAAQKAAEDAIKTEKCGAFISEHLGGLMTREQADAKAELLRRQLFGSNADSAPKAEKLVAMVLDASTFTEAIEGAARIYVKWRAATPAELKAEAIAKALANGAIAIDGVILCDDGTEILIGD